MLKKYLSSFSFLLMFVIFSSTIIFANDTKVALNYEILNSEIIQSSENTNTSTRELPPPLGSVTLSNAYIQNGKIYVQIHVVGQISSSIATIDGRRVLYSYFDTVGNSPIREWYYTYECGTYTPGQTYTFEFWCKEARFPNRTFTDSWKSS